MDYYVIGQRIRKARKACGLSQEELAERVGISVTHLSHIETGNTKMSLEIFFKLSEELNVHTDDLLRDRPNTDANYYLSNILSTLEDCNATQLRILEKILSAAKDSLEENIHS